MVNTSLTAFGEYGSLNGGKGSGNFGHAGRPGKVGGSGKSSSTSLAEGRMLKGVREYDPENGMDGGFTVDPKTGESHRLGKSKGYAVGGYGTEKIVDVADFEDKAKRKKILKDYMKENEKVFDSGSNVKIGGWIPSEGEYKGKLILDISKVFSDRKEAGIEMVKTDQDSITDFAGSTWLDQDTLVKEYGLEELQKKYKGMRDKERHHA